MANSLTAARLERLHGYRLCHDDYCSKRRCRMDSTRLCDAPHRWLHCANGAQHTGRSRGKISQGTCNPLQSRLLPLPIGQPAHGIGIFEARIFCGRRSANEINGPRGTGFRTPPATDIGVVEGAARHIQSAAKGDSLAHRSRFFIRFKAAEEICAAATFSYPHRGGPHSSNG